MSIALEYPGMGKRLRNLAFMVGIVSASSAFAAPRVNNTPVPGSADGSVKALVRIAPIYPREAEVLTDNGACLSAQLTLTTSGRVANLEVVGAYPTIHHIQKYGYVEAIRQVINGWRFAAQSKGADFSSTPKVLQKIIFIRVPPETVSSVMALRLVCKQPYLLAPKPISILSSSASQQDSSESAAEAGRKAGAGAVAGISISIPRAMHITRSWQGDENIRAQFCVDPQKRIANVVLKGGTQKGQAVALAALDELPVAAARVQQSASQPQQLSTIIVTAWRTGDESLVQRMEQTESKAIEAGIPIWACGLRVKVRLFAEPKGRTIGLIERTSFGQLSGESNMPPIIATHSPHQNLTVPTGAKLPDKARIEVEFCITPGGSPSTAHVVSAKPAKIFDQAALKVVAGWRFARRAHMMCNVYQTVGFKIPNSAPGA